LILRRRPPNGGVFALGFYSQGAKIGTVGMPAGLHMKEYTILALLFTAAPFLLDKVCAAGIFKQKIFYLFLALIFFFKLLVNGYLTSTEIFVYNPKFYLGLRLGSISLEDFLFAFSMQATTIILWEYFKKQHRT
jgi:lycopene cyclase domain-containing protein